MYYAPIYSFSSTFPSYYKNVYSIEEYVSELFSMTSCLKYLDAVTSNVREK